MLSLKDSHGINVDSGDPQRFRSHLYGGINFHTISNLIVQNCTFQHSMVRGLSLVIVSGFVYIINSYFANNANYDTIFCYSKAGYIGCDTTNTVLTGGILIKSNSTNTSRNIDIHIENCVFNGNGYFGNVNDTTVLYLSRKFHKVPFSPGLTIRIVKPDLDLTNILITNSIFSFNRGTSSASSVALYIYVKTKNPNTVLTGLQFWNNSAIKFYDNSSALKVLHGNYNKNTKYILSLLNMSSCSFYGNHGGQNMLSYAV